VACNLDQDCPEEDDQCEGHVCVGCHDAVLNQQETDVDCGGPNCPKCDEGDACVGDDDCKGKFDCIAGICQDD
jgi:hypothetical protein